MKFKFKVLIILIFLAIKSISVFGEDGDVDLTLNPPDVSPPIFSEFGTRGANITDLFNRNNQLNSVALDETNRIIGAGVSQYNANGDNLMVVNVYTNFPTEIDPNRLFGDGILDPNIPGDDIVPPGIITIQLGRDSAAYDVQITDDNNIVLGGYGTAENSNNPDFAVVKIDPTLGFDTRFNPQGQVPGTVIEPLSPFGSRVNSIALAPSPSGQENIIAAGFYRVQSELDPSGFANAPVIAFYASNGERQWLTALPDTLDGINILGPVIKVVYDRANQKIIALTSSAFIDPETNEASSTTNIIRLNMDGTLDTTFQTNLEEFPILNITPGIIGVFLIGNPQAMTIDNFSNIIITINNDVIGLTLRLTPQATLDNTFAQSSPIPGVLFAIPTVIDPENDFFTEFTINNINLIDNQTNFYKIVLSGFISKNIEPNITQTSALVMRFTQDGVPDQTFNPSGKRTILETTEAALNGRTITEVSNVIPQPDRVEVIVVQDSLESFLSATREGREPNILTLPYGAHVYEFQNASNNQHRDTRLLGATIDHFGRIITVGDYVSNQNNLDFLAMRYKSDTFFGVDENQVVDKYKRKVLQPSILWPTSNTIINTDNITIIGRTQPNNQVEVRLNNTSLGLTKANQAGYWSYTIDNLENQKYNIAAIDQPTRSLSQINVTVNKTLTDELEKSSILIQDPKEPIKEILASDPNLQLTELQQSDLSQIAKSLSTSKSVVNIESPKHKSIVNTPTPTITGTTSPDAIVTLKLNDRTLTNVQANSKGEWQYKVNNIKLSDGNYKITSINKDTNQADTIDIKVDTKIEPPQDIVAKGSILTGKAEPNSIVTVFINNNLTNRIQADPTGNWQYNMPINPEGKYKIDIATTDQAGNTSAIVTKRT